MNTQNTQPEKASVRQKHEIKRLAHTVHCNLCGASSTVPNIEEAGEWVANHGCNYGRASVEPEAAHESGDHCPACFNAGYDAAAKQRDEVTAQRDALLAACKAALSAMSQTVQFTTVSQRRRIDTQARESLRAAIAQASGEIT